MAISNSNSQVDAKQSLIKQLVVFEIDKEEYAVDIKDLQEITLIPEVTHIPNAPSFIRGIINLRGKIIVVIDLEKRFNLKRENALGEGNIIICEVENNNFGVMVDKVNEIINIEVSAIQPTPTLVSTKINSEYLEGVVVMDKEGVKKDEGEISKKKLEESRLIILLGLKNMLSEKELLNISKNLNISDKKSNK